MSSHTRWPLNLFLTILIASSCLAQISPSPGKKPAQTNAAQEGAIVEERKTSVRFDDDGTLHETFRERVKVQTESALKDYGIITFSFIAGQEFNIDTVEVHKKDGTTVKAGAEHTQEVTPEISRIAPMYSDLRQKQVTVPGLSIGDEVVFQYSTRRTPLAPNQFWFEYRFDKNLVVLSETVEVNVPKARAVKVHSQPEYQPVVKDEGERTVYLWHGSNDRIPDEDERIKTQKERLKGHGKPPSLELSSFATWEQVGAWYNDLQSERAKSTPAIKAKAAELTSGLSTPEAKIKALYQFVSLNFRYIGVDFGIGRYQPHAAGEVLANGYGDCKDKHTLLAALLDAAGIQSFPVLIGTQRDIEPSVPSPGQFDHLITAVPVGSDLVFLDTTAEVAPFGMLFSPLRRKKALVVKGPSFGQLVETPANPPFAAREIFEFNGKVDETGTMEAEVSLSMRGDTALLVKSIFRGAPPSKYKDLAQAFSYSYGFGGEVSDVKVDSLQELEKDLTVSYHYHRADYFDLHDASPKNSLPLGTSHFPPWQDKSETLLLYSSPAELTYKCRVELPAGFTADAPLPIKLVRDYARYVSTYSVDKNILKGEKTVAILVGEITREHHDNYESFARTLSADESQQITLQLPAGFVAKSGAATTVDLDEIAQRAEIEFRQRDYGAALADYHKVAERDPKRKGIWTSIGLAEANRGRLDFAIESYLKAIEADPLDARAHTELGASYMSRLRYDDALAQLKKALEIDPLSHRTHYLLGWYYATIKKDFASAAPELERAISTGPTSANEEKQLNNMLSDAYLRLKQTDKAVDMIKRTVAASPDAFTWNNAAYSLADNGIQLDLAAQYADSALKELYAKLDAVGTTNVRITDFLLMSQLVNTWDTRGWIYFKSGDTASADRYVRAAWTIGQAREVGEHMGEICEKLGRQKEAIHFYAMTAALPPFQQSAPNLSKERLIKILGKPRAESLISQSTGSQSMERTLHLGNIAPDGTRGEFYFVFTPGPKLESIQTLSGDSALRNQLQAISSQITAGVIFPDTTPTKLFRQGIVTCSPYSKGCILVFYNIDTNGMVSGGR